MYSTIETPCAQYWTKWKIKTLAIDFPRKGPKSQNQKNLAFSKNALYLGLLYSACLAIFSACQCLGLYYIIHGVQSDWHFISMIICTITQQSYVLYYVVYWTNKTSSQQQQFVVHDKYTHI